MRWNVIYIVSNEKHQASHSCHINSSVMTIAGQKSKFFVYQVARR